MLHIVGQPRARRGCLVTRTQKWWRQEASVTLGANIVVKLRRWQERSFLTLYGLTQVWHQLSLEGWLPVLALGINSAQVTLKVTLNLVLKEWWVSTLFRFLLLIQQKFCQKNGVLSLILLQFLVKILILLNFVIQHRGHLIELFFEFLVLSMHLFDIFFHFHELSLLLEPALLSRFTVLNKPFVFSFFWLGVVIFRVVVLFLKFISVWQVRPPFASTEHIWLALRLDRLGVLKLIIKLVIDFLHRVQMWSAAPVVLQEFLSKLQIAFILLV